MSNFMQSFPMGLRSKAQYSPSKKTRELIIYLTSKLKDKSDYESILLEKALYLIDSISYIRKGKPITDFKYIKENHGPSPAQLPSISKNLVANGELQKIKAEYPGGTHFKWIAAREPDIEVFEKDEILLINDVLERISNQKVTDISDFPHNLLGWMVANDKEEIPYYTSLFISKKPEAKDYEWALKAVEKYEASRKNDS
jgi:hypothetical protein